MIHPIAAALAVASLAAAAAYGIVWVVRPAGWVRTGLKTAAVGALALGALSEQRVWLLALAIGLRTMGDFVLAVDEKRGLPSALFSLLLAQAAYLALFLHAGGGMAMFRAQPLRLAGIMTIVSATVLVVRLIWPRLGALKAPSAVYALAAAGMAMAALALPAARWPAMAGAAAFFASDGVLAVRIFRFGGARDPVADRTVWALYYLGQAGMAAGFLLN